MRSALSLALLCACFAQASAGAETAPRADEVVTVEAVIPYLNDESAGEDVRSECDWNRTMPQHLSSESKGRVRIGAASTAGDPGRRLQLVTQTLHTAGGAQFSGPKWLVVEGTLTSAGKTIGNFEARRQTFRGAFSACKTLRELGDDIADDILEWLDAPGLNAKLGDAK